MDGAHARDNSGPGQMNTVGVGNGGQTTEQATVRVASRQSRIDKYQLIVPVGITYDNPARRPA